MRQCCVKWNSTAESLKQWYLNHIDHFRKEYAKLSPDEQKGLDHRNNFLDPCQIEIFWITNPNYQMIVLSNHKDRPDKQIIINGPYSSREFQSQATTILAKKWWTRDLVDDSGEVYEQADTLGEAMAEEAYRFVSIIKSDMFQQRQDVHYLVHAVLVGGVWASMRAGNIGDLDYIQEAGGAIQDVKRAAKFKQEQRPPPQHLGLLADDTYMGFGAHFFPPIMLGKKRKPTIEQRIYNPLTTRIYNNMAFSMEIDGHKVVVNDDGVVFVEIKGKNLALKILNLAMACGMFYRLNSPAVHERDLVMSDYDERTLALTSMQWNTGTGREHLLEDRFNPRSTNLHRIQVKPETIREILSNTEKLLAHETLADDLRLFNEGLTHFGNSEFAPAFVMGWTVIERHYNALCKVMLAEKKIKDRLGKSANPDQWTFHVVLESLNRHGVIDEGVYGRLMYLKKKRNGFYHGGLPIAKDDAECCIAHARKLINGSVKPLITISNDLILPEHQT